MGKQLVDDKEYTLLLMTAHYSKRLIRIQTNMPFHAFTNPKLENEIKDKLKECVILLEDLYGDKLQEEVYAEWSNKLESELSSQGVEISATKSISMSDSTTTSESSETTS